MDETFVYIDKQNFIFIFKFKYLNHWNFYKNWDPKEFQPDKAAMREPEFQRL